MNQALGFGVPASAGQKRNDGAARTKLHVPKSVRFWHQPEMLARNVSLLNLLAGADARFAAVGRPGMRNTSFEFALIGDVPYTDFITTNSYRNMIAEINHARLAVVVHDGDSNAGSTPCSREILESWPQ